MPNFSIHWPAIIVLLSTLVLLLLPVLKNTVLTILCLVIVSGTSIYYINVQAKQNPIKHISEQHKKTIQNALNNFSQTKQIDNKNLLFCNAMLYAFSTVKDTHTTLINTAECYEKKGFPSIGHDITQYVLKHQPDYPPALYLKTKTHLNIYGIDSIEFINSLTHLLQNAPDHPDGLWLLSAHQYYKGDYTDALATLNKVEPLIKNNPAIKERNKKLNKLKQFRTTIQQALVEREN